MREYSWWGADDPPPDHLKTKKQLSELGLSGKRPVGFIDTKKYRVLLFDSTDPISAAPKRKPSEAQLAVLRRGREKTMRRAWQMEYGRHLESRNRAIRWARTVLESPEDSVILDFETTGLFNAEAVEVGIIDLTGATLLHSLISPTIPIPPEATAVHGISDADVADATVFPEVHARISEAIGQRMIVTYNLGFDLGVLRHCEVLHSLPRFEQTGAACLMTWYSEFCGEWSHWRQSYLWQRLEGGHRALADCNAALQLLIEMAEAPLLDEEEAFQEYLRRFLPYDPPEESQAFGEEAQTMKDLKTEVAMERTESDRPGV